MNQQQSSEYLLQILIQMQIKSIIKLSSIINFKIITAESYLTDYKHNFEDICYDFYKR